LKKDSFRVGEGVLMRALHFDHVGRACDYLETLTTKDVLLFARLLLVGTVLRNFVKSFKSLLFNGHTKKRVSS
jgi:hypothetical protein